MTAQGQKRKSSVGLGMSAFRGKADLKFGLCPALVQAVVPAKVDVAIVGSGHADGGKAENDSC